MGAVFQDRERTARALECLDLAGLIDSGLILIANSNPEAHLNIRNIIFASLFVFDCIGAGGNLIDCFYRCESSIR